LNPKNKKKAQKKPKREPDTWSFLAFDKDMYCFESYSFSNYLEILTYLLAPFALVFFANFHATSSVLILIIVCVQFTLWSVHSGGRHQEVNKEKRRLGFIIAQKLSKIYRQWEMDHAAKKYNKGKSKALQIIRMTNPEQEKENRSFDVQAVLKNCKIDEYGVRLDNVSFWKANDGRFKLVMSIVVIICWLTNTTRSLGTCIDDNFE
jgi:hypothetical protein